MTFAGLVAPFAAVLAVSGVAKVTRPHSVGPALAALGLRHTLAAARLVGVAEVTLGTMALTVGGHWPGGATAVWYAGLTATSVALVQRGPAVPCGCFGDRSAPPSHVHTATNAVGAAIAGVAAVAGPSSLAAILLDTPLGGTLLALQVALGTWLLLAVYRDLPRPAHAPRPGEFTLVGRR